MAALEIWIGWVILLSTLLVFTAAVMIITTKKLRCKKRAHIRVTESKKEGNGSENITNICGPSKKIVANEHHAVTDMIASISDSGNLELGNIETDRSDSNDNETKNDINDSSESCFNITKKEESGFNDSDTNGSNENIGICKEKKDVNTKHGKIGNIMLIIRSKIHMKTDENYVLLRNAKSWQSISMSLYASFMGNWMLFLPSDVGYNYSWLGVVGYALSSSLPYFFLIYFAKKVKSLSMDDGFCSIDHIYKKYGRFCQICFALISLMLMFVGLCTELTTLGITFNLIFADKHTIENSSGVLHMIQSSSHTEANSTYTLLSDGSVFTYNKDHLNEENAKDERNKYIFDINGKQENGETKRYFSIITTDAKTMRSRDNGNKTCPGTSPPKQQKNQNNVASSANDTSGFPTYVPVLFVSFFTLLYSFYGGLDASITTDVYQGIVILLSLIPIFICTFIYIPLSSFRLGSTISMQSFLGGIILLLSIWPVFLLDQGIWQRIWSCRNDERSLNYALISCGVMTFSSVFLFGTIGIAIGGFRHRYAESFVDDACSFCFLASIADKGVLVLIAIFAITCVASSVDTYQTAMVSIFAFDMKKKKYDFNLARLIIVLVNIPAIVISSLNLDVLSIFMVGNLLACCVSGPMILSVHKYTTRLGIIFGIFFSFLTTFFFWVF